MSEQPAAAGEVVLVARGLEVVYRRHARRSLRSVVTREKGRRGREVHAVRGVDVDLHRGESLGIIGRNGSGKSTLLRSLAGLVPPTRGTVHAHAVPVLLGVGAALQQDLSCRRNAVLGGTALGRTRRDAAAQVDEVLAFAGLEDYADMPFRTLSSGMRARLQFAIASSVRPEILMIDEALAVGDVEFKRRSQERMAELVAGSGTVVIVSHSMGFLRRNCTRVVWLDKGLVAGDGAPGEVIDAYLEATG